MPLREKRHGARRPPALGLRSVRTLSLTLLPDRLAVCRLDPGAALPEAPAAGSLWSVTRTAEEVSVVLPEQEVRPGWKVEPGWRVFQVAGPLDFGLTGVVASLTQPLADAGIPVFVLSTFDTDYLLIKEDTLERTRTALAGAGHEVRTAGTRTTFKDHFSSHARDYASYRPGYPEELFDFVASLPSHRGTVWDVGTGSGQAALGLAERFERVIGTDPSAQQLEHAEPHPRVEYRVAPAESSGLPDASVDLVAAAQAFHWFDFDCFFAEARRVLAPGGAVVVWTYNLARVSPPVDAWTDRLAHGIVGPYWPPERKWVNEEYRTIPFPFPEVEAPSFFHRERWDLERYLLYIGTWSACQRYARETGSDAIAENRRDAEPLWGDPREERIISWPIFLRASQPVG